MRTRSLGPVLALLVAGLLVAACASAGAPLQGIGGEPAASAPAAPAPGAGEGDGDVAGGVADAALLIRTGSLSLEVADVAAAVANGRALVVGMGGYISASDESTFDEQTIATVTYRIPAERWEEAQDRLRALGERVLDARTNVVEVTAQARDLDARIRNLRASEVALQAILSTATRVEDVLDVQREITAVREEIEKLTAEKDALDDQVALATLSVTYASPTTALAQTARGWDLAAEVDRAGSFVVQLIQALAILTVWLIIVGLPLTGLGVAIWYVAKLVQRRVEERRRAPMSPPASTPTG